MRPAQAPRSPRFEELEQQMLGELFGIMVSVRLLVIPALLLLLAVVAVFDPSPWRAKLLLALLLSMGGFFVAEAVRFRREGLRPGGIELNLAGILVVQAGAFLATGGLISPLTHAIGPMVLLVGLFARGPQRTALVLGEVAVVWSLFAVEWAGALVGFNPPAFGGGPRGTRTDTQLILQATMLTFAVGAGFRAGMAIRAAFDAMVRRALQAQAELLAAHAERAEELTRLTAEIAHELKNPLASVKGLAGLLESALPQGKALERMGVLRREVSRMQSVLDEFLNFSRPLVPLSLTQVDLRELAVETARLHEGLAHERAVSLSVVDGPSVLVTADLRKVKQVLINLIQNALDASPREGAIVIEVRSDGDSGTVEVRDQGSGLSPAIAGSAFEPFVTTKANGSGLGLTVARALARQHGGELELRALEEGGTCARLRLPIVKRVG